MGITAFPGAPLTWLYSAGETSNRHRRISLAPGHGIGGIVLKTGKPMLFTDIDSEMDPREYSSYPHRLRRGPAQLLRFTPQTRRPCGSRAAMRFPHRRSIACENVPCAYADELAWGVLRARSGIRRVHGAWGNRRPKRNHACRHLRRYLVRRRARYRRNRRAEAVARRPGSRHRRARRR